MDLHNKFMWMFLISSLLSMRTSDGDGLRLPDQAPKQNIIESQNVQNMEAIIHQQNSGQQIFGPAAPSGEERHRQGKGLLDLVGLGTGPNVDPYVARTNTNCLSGDLSECFKTHAIGTFDDFFLRDAYKLTDFARVVRMPEIHQRSLYSEPYEFSSEERSTDSEWDQLVKFALRKVEKFIKSTALEVHVPEELTDNGRYSPRLIDDIADEIDIIEDKKAPLFTRHKLKKLFIPLLLVLKIFKLKLLLFLPFILGLASLKKILGLAAIILPGLFAYFKLCRPQQQPFGSFYSNNGFPQYSPQGIGPASYSNGFEHFSGNNPYVHHEPSFVKPYTEYYGKTTNIDNGIRFGEHPQDLAYQGYSQYRNNEKEVS